MAKDRSGYIYQEKIYFGAVEYADLKGNRQSVKKRAKSLNQATEIAENIANDLRKELGDRAKLSETTISQKGDWVARVTYTDVQGKRHNIKRYAENKTDAKEELRRLLRQLDDRGENAIEGDKLTFKALAETYEERKIQPAEYHDDRKVRGLRSYQTPRGYLRTLVSYFGSRRVKSITHSDIEQFKQDRLKATLASGKARTIASANRELELLRAMLRFAVRQGWVARSPFEMGSPLISKADEVRRERVLSHEEEARLLSVCTGRRAHLRALLIAALDTGARRGELFKLTWGDVDFENRLINLRATTTKTQRGRAIGMTSRIANELQQLFEKSTKDVDQLVFGITDTIKTAFASACKEAGIESFRFHDCRHTAITRMIQSGMAAHLIMKVSGHTQPITFSRYVNVDDQTARQAASALDTFNSMAMTANGPESVN